MYTGQQRGTGLSNQDSFISFLTVLISRHLQVCLFQRGKVVTCRRGNTKQQLLIQKGLLSVNPAEPMHPYHRKADNQKDSSPETPAAS